MPASTLNDLLEAGVAGRTVLIRSDLNVPLDGDTVTDDGRIRASLPAIRDLAEAGARVIVMAHLGRPKGEPDPAYSLRPVAARMAELLGTDVALAADVTGDDARAKAAALQDGQVLLLENVRKVQDGEDPLFVVRSERENTWTGLAGGRVIAKDANWESDWFIPYTPADRDASRA